MNLTVLFIYLLATWRLSSLIVREDGPFYLFRKFRELFGIVHDDQGPIQWPDRFMPSLLTCVWCTSLWVAVGWVVLGIFFQSTTIYIASPFALSAGAILLDKVLKKL